MTYFFPCFCFSSLACIFCVLTQGIFSDTCPKCHNLAKCENKTCKCKDGYTGNGINNCQGNMNLPF